VLAIIAILLIIWLVVTVLGAVIKGLFWLAIIGGLLFLATAAYGAVKRRNNPSIR
jgi:LPXTG-motif cell wall-anchored protein